MKQKLHITKPLENDILKEVLKFCSENDKIRTTELQIKFKWGYHRAGHTIDLLYDMGIVEAYTGSFYRKILKSKTEIETIINSL